MSIKFTLRYITAIHEAGHAVMHILNGGCVYHVTLTLADENQRGGVTAEQFNIEDKDGCRREILTSLAGEAALIVFGVPDEAREDLDIVRDRARADSLAQRICIDDDGWPDDGKVEDYLRHCSSEAVVIFEKVENRRKLETVVQALMKLNDGDKITGIQLREMLG